MRLELTIFNSKFSRASVPGITNSNMNEHVEISAPETIEQVVIQVSEAWEAIFRRVATNVRGSMECTALVSPAQFYLLKILSNHGAQRMSELAALLDITQSGCTAMVDRAIAAGHAQRTRDPSDRRVVWVEITGGGERALQEMQRIHASLVAHQIREMDVEEVEELADLMQQMAKVLLAIKQQEEICESTH